MSKQYTMSFAAACEHKPEHPDRTAKRSLGWDVTFQVWTNRAAMARSIRMQERKPDSRWTWRPCVPLASTEGY